MFAVTFDTNKQRDEGTMEKSSFSIGAILLLLFSMYSGKRKGFDRKRQEEVTT